jgi:transposase
MMGRLKSGQGQLFYEFHLSDAIPEDHLVRKIDAALDLSWLRGELAPHYSSTGRPSIDPELMIRMLVVGYVFAIRSERLICREVQVNLAYRWFCRLGIEDAIPDHSAFSRARNERCRRREKAPPSASHPGSTWLDAPGHLVRKRPFLRQDS